jgi:hypothetical protein
MVRQKNGSKYQTDDGNNHQHWEPVLFHFLLSFVGDGTTQPIRINASAIKPIHSNPFSSSTPSAVHALSGAQSFITLLPPAPVPVATLVAETIAAVVPPTTAGTIAEGVKTEATPTTPVVTAPVIRPVVIAPFKFAHPVNRRHKLIEKNLNRTNHHQNRDYQNDNLLFPAETIYPSSKFTTIKHLSFSYFLS